jgi:peptidoglycan/LPS O-acetylase OafA/YrhL
MKSTYHPEIDGLRALAVVSVLLFHGFPNLLPGGFVGVDMFFTISGYLITSIIFQELQTNQFSYWSFYQRRIRRIFPSLILVLMACSIIGWIILTPAEYELFGTHLATSAGFVPNFRFWREAGYFDKEAITKPLLHLWSLGVEEQFYLLWPVILGLGWRFLSQSINRLTLFISALLISSLTLSYFTVHVNPTADFYSPLTRFWELGLGGLIALLTIFKKIQIHPLFKNSICSLGGLLLLFAVTQLNEQLAFPGMWALLPCLGTGLILFCLNSNSTSIPPSMVLNILKQPLIVWIGLISYPLYLWHWPLLSFARILEGQELSSQVRGYLLILSVILAFLCYQFLEKPIRKQRHRYWSFILLALMVCLLSFGITLRKQDGFKQRHQAQMLADPSTMILGEFRDEIRRSCHIAQQMPSDLDCFEDVRDPVRYALLGDSKAEALFYGLTAVSTEKGRWLLVDGVHPPPPNASESTLGEHLAKSKMTFDLINQDPQIKVVVLANALRGIFQIDPKTGFILGLGHSESQLQNFDELIKSLEQAGKSVIFVIDNPTFPDPTSCISGGLTNSDLLNRVFYRKANPYCSIRYEDQLEGTKAYRQWVSELAAKHPQMQVIDLPAYLCNIAENRCQTTENGSFLYSYSDHISDYAAKKIGTVITTMADQTRNHLGK